MLRDKTRIIQNSLLRGGNNARVTYRVGQKSDTSRTLHYIVREVSLFLAHPVVRKLHFEVADDCTLVLLHHQAYMYFNQSPAAENL